MMRPIDSTAFAEMSEYQAKLDTFHARLADPTIPANEWAWYQRGLVSPDREGQADAGPRV